MFHACTMLIFTLLLRKLEKNPPRKWMKILPVFISILTLLIMHNIYNWNKDVDWSWYFNFLFVFSSITFYYSFIVVLQQWPNLRLKHLSHPLQNKILAYSLTTISILVLLLRIYTGVQ